jgi:hypothetical protein
VDLYTTRGQSERAVEVCLDYLRRVGIDWSPHPTHDEVREELARMWRRLGSRPIEELVDLPPMTDLVWRATADVLTAIPAPASFTDANLLSLVVARTVNLSLEHGNSDGSRSWSKRSTTPAVLVTITAAPRQSASCTFNP